uniref:Uncharacterized protein n=1 Tax=Romanomermis culicivorax TaxID=13658 RepID=A0A915JZC5_ROMCU
SFILAFFDGIDHQQLETSSLKIHFSSERITAILRKTTDGNSQRTERKFLFRSVTLCRLHSVPLEKSSINDFFPFRWNGMESTEQRRFGLRLSSIGFRKIALYFPIETRFSGSFILAFFGGTECNRHTVTEENENFRSVRLEVTVGHFLENCSDCIINLCPRGHSYSKPTKTFTDTEPSSGNRKESCCVHNDQTLLLCNGKRGFLYGAALLDDKIMASIRSCQRSKSTDGKVTSHGKR